MCGKTSSGLLYCTLWVNCNVLAPVCMYVSGLCMQSYKWPPLSGVFADIYV